MKRRYFGTDGVRGPYGSPWVCEAFFRALAGAAGSWLSARGVPSGSVLIGRDTRSSGSSLALALAHGFAGAGMRPVLLDVVPTPAVSREVGMRGSVLGAVVTASHNPAADNGVKFFGSDGSKLSDEDEVGIEARVAVPEAAAREADAEPERASVLDAYIEAAGRVLPPHALVGWRIAIDTANGAASRSSPAVLTALGADVTALGNCPDGANINEGVGSEHPEGLSAAVQRQGARIGIAHDGDGDRCVLCDEAGSVLDGDEVLTILATHALARGTLAARTLVVTVQSNLGVDAAVEAAGGRVVRTDIGDRHVAARMRAEGATLGGEASGHIVCFDFGPTGDGLVAALRVAAVMNETGKPLSELRRVLRKFPQRSASLVVREKRPLESLGTLCAAIRALEEEFGVRGRVLVRYSGTEPKIRLLVEGSSDLRVGSALDQLAAAVRADLDVL